MANLTEAEQNFRITWRDHANNLLKNGTVGSLYGPVGGAIHAQHGSKVLISEGVGRLGLTKTRPWGSDTVGGIMSCTKTMFGAVVMRAVQDGYIDLDDTLGDYSIIYDNFNGVALTGGDPEGTLPLEMTLTLRQCMALMVNYQLSSKSGATNYNFQKTTSTVADLRNDWLTFGNVWNSATYPWVYSDKAFHLIGFILEDVTGKSVVQLFNEMFSTLGMLDTAHHYDWHPDGWATGYKGFYAKGQRPPSNSADALIPDGGGGYEWRPWAEPETMYCIAGVMTTAIDFARFFQAIATPDLYLNSTSIAEYFSAQTGDVDKPNDTKLGILSDPFVNYGLGIYKFDISGLEAWGGEGAGLLGEYAGFAVYIPSEDFVSVAQSNGLAFPSSPYTSHIAYLMAEDWVDNVKV